MTTPAQLRKYAQPLLTPGMLARGFDISQKGLKFYRKAGDIYHFVIPTLVGMRDQIIVHLVPWVPEIMVGYDMKEFPERIADVVLANLTPTKVEHVGSSRWTIEPETRAQTSFSEILGAFDHHGLPWFDRIVSREALANIVYPSERIDALGNNTADLILFRGEPKLPS
ncbi:MAG: hypothetical protein JWR16_3232 [Nevskia sp.]|nr:hypothetical protein [Nevskia sp.]